MNKKCTSCNLVNFSNATNCARCQAALIETSSFETDGSTRKPGLIVRGVVCLCVCAALILVFYLSLLASAKKLSPDEMSAVRKSIAILRAKGFSNEAMLLDNFTVFRSSDNWLNASVEKENAYAATNFPFEIMTLYPDFFTYPIDDIERAAILLHESKHLAGKNEHEAYKFVWKSRQQLGWTMDKYATSAVWQDVRRQTKDNVPELFICTANEYGDCTE